MTRKALLVLSLAAMAVVVTDRMLRRYRPVCIPPGLAREVIKLEAEGWTVPRWEPLACRERAPHAHLTAPGGLRLTIGIDGKVRVTSIPAF